MDKKAYIFSTRNLRRLAISAAVSTAVMGSIQVSVAETNAPPETVWASLKGDVFGDRNIAEADGLVTIEAPKRAEDAAIVPINLKFKTENAVGEIKAVTLIIDENPAPVAAVFKFGEDAGVSHLSTRVRVNAYSYVRAIAETKDGKLYMTRAFVKASGGCSAPAVSNQDEAMASLGKMKFRVFTPKPEEPAKMTKTSEVQLMIRHPNNSGLQMDQLTRYYIPAHFVQELTIKQGDRTIMTMEGGISISEDPNFRFEFNASPDKEISAVATDTDGKIFKGDWPLTVTSN